jgi:hypothetical protein
MIVEDILAQLREGDNIDDIAKDMTTALNEAKRRYEKEQAEEAAKREAEQAATMKRADAAQICTLIDKFLKTYYGDIPQDGPLSTDDFIAVVDSIAEVFRAIQKVENKVEPAVKKCGDDFDNAIEDFLNKFVR